MHWLSRHSDLYPQTIRHVSLRNPVVLRFDVYDNNRNRRMGPRKTVYSGILGLHLASMVHDRWSERYK